VIGVRFVKQVCQALLVRSPPIFTILPEQPCISVLGTHRRDSFKNAMLQGWNVRWGLREEIEGVGVVMVIETTFLISNLHHRKAADPAEFLASRTKIGSNLVAVFRRHHASLGLFSLPSPIYVIPPIGLPKVVIHFVIQQGIK